MELLISCGCDTVAAREPDGEQLSATGHQHTMTLPSFLRVQPDGILLAIKLQPRASANEIGEPLGNELRIKVTAPPVDAAANEALVRLLAETFNCPRNQVELVRGHTSRHKTVKIYGAKPENVTAALGHKG